MRSSQLFLVVLSCCILTLTTTQSIYDQYYEEARKIAEGMTLEQKIGQTIQADIEAITEKGKQITNPDQAVTLNLGSLLIAGNAAPTTDGNLAKIPISVQQEKVIEAYKKGTQQNWKKLVDRLVKIGVKVTSTDKKQYLIKFLLGTDAVHGDQHTLGRILFPHNIGLSCSRNPDHFQNVGYWTQISMKKIGFNYAFAPTVAVSHNPQWGRFYQTMGQQHDNIRQYAKAFTAGLQSVSNGKINGVLACAKHFFGDGSTMYGANEGTAQVLSLNQYINHNTQGYAGATQSQVGSVMVSYSAINNIPNSQNSLFLLGLLRDEIQFKGFTISDYDDVIRTATMLTPRTFINTTEERGYAVMASAGTDMIMLSGKHNQFESQVNRVLKQAKKAVEKGLHQQSRLTESVTRILQVKMAMGLVQSTSNPEPENQNHESIPPKSSSGDQYQDSLKAVHQSLILLKNTNTIPAKSLYLGIQYVVLIGEKIHDLNRLGKRQLFRNFDNIGMQCGGWSVRWQGFEGNEFWSGDDKQKTKASSILDALKDVQKVNKFQLLYPEYTSFTNQITIQRERRQFIEELKKLKKSMNSKNSIIIGSFGEYPYAESEGDVNIPYCHEGNQLACLYNPSRNSYAPGSQPKSLQISMTKFQEEVYNEIKSIDKNIPLVSVLISGRPRLIGSLLDQSNAVIAAWLPGTSGGKGIINAITGDYIIRPNGQSEKVNTLSMDWPKTMASLSNFPIYGTNGQIPKISDPQFQVGFGLSSFTGSKEQPIKNLQTSQE